MPRSAPLTRMAALVLLAYGVLGLSGCAAPVALLEGAGDGASYRLETEGWMRYAGQQATGLVDPTVVRLRSRDGSAVTLAGLRALGVVEMDHVRSLPGAPGTSEVHFLTPQAGFEAYKRLRQGNLVRHTWAEVALHDLGPDAPRARMEIHASPARALGSR